MKSKNELSLIILRESIGVYTVILSLYILIKCIAMTGAMIEGPVNIAIYRLLMIMSGMLAVWVFIVLVRNKRIDVLKSKATWFALAYLIWLGVVVFANRDLGFSENIIGVMTFGTLFFLYYFMELLFDGSRIKFWFSRIMLFFGSIWTIMCIWSIAMFFFGIRYKIYYSPEKGMVRQGFTDGRLFGKFTDPNLASLISLMIIIGLIFLMREYKIKALKKISWIAITINAVYIVLSYSRTLYIACVMACLYIVFITGREKLADGSGAKVSPLKYHGRRFITAIVVMLAFYFVVSFGFRGFIAVVFPDRDIEREMIRDDVNEENISNNRFDIWFGYLELVKDRPVTGFGPRGSIEYAVKNHPENFIARSGYETHNSYLSFLVDSGAVGFLLMAGFLIISIINIFKRLKTKQVFSGEEMLLSSYMLIMFVYAMFFSGVFFQLNLESISVWAGAGLFQAKALKNVNE